MSGVSAGNLVSSFGQVTVCIHETNVVPSGSSWKMEECETLAALSTPTATTTFESKETLEVATVQDQKNLKDKKVMRSIAGTATLNTSSKPATTKPPGKAAPKKPVIKPPQKQTMLQRGSYVASVTLHYCSTVGLIHVGVLEKPPGWINNPAPLPGRASASQPSMDLSKIPPAEKISFKDDETGLKREVFQYDLTGLSDSEQHDENTGPEKIA